MLLFNLLAERPHPCDAGGAAAPALAQQDLEALRPATPQAQALCASMLAAQPEERPSAGECLRHPWLEPESAARRPERVLPLESLSALVKHLDAEESRQAAVEVVVQELRVGAPACGAEALAALRGLSGGAARAQAFVPFALPFYLRDAKYGRYVVAQGGQAAGGALELHFGTQREQGTQFTAEYEDNARFYLRDAKHGMYVQPQDGQADKNGVLLHFKPGKDIGDDRRRMQFVMEPGDEGAFYLKDAKRGLYVHPRGGQASSSAVALVYWEGKDCGKDARRMQFSVEHEALHAAAELAQLGLSVVALARVGRAFDPEGSGAVALGGLASGCHALAEEQLDRALWGAFQAAGEEHSGVLTTAQLAEVLRTDSTAADAAHAQEMAWAGPEVRELGQLLRAAAGVAPELSASEAAQLIADGRPEVCLEALQDLLLRRA